MNPSDWIYHLNLRTLVHENGFLDPCARAGARPERVHRPRDGERGTATGLAVLLPPLLALAALIRR